MGSLSGRVMIVVGENQDSSKDGNNVNIVQYGGVDVKKQSSFKESFFIH